MMYWLPKMHKKKKFIVATRKCSTTKAFKLILKQIQSFHEKSHFYSDCKKFRVVENSKSLIDSLDQINTKQNAQLMST